MKALVTGAAGFLGYHLCQKLRKENFDVVGVDNFCTGLKSNAALLEKAGVSIIEADVSQSWEAWSRELQSEFEFVFHFASPASPPLYQKLPLETLAVNSMGLYRALEFATAKKGRLVFASTSEIYGSPNVHPQPENYWGNTNSFGPRSCYDEAKRFGEALLYSYNQQKKTTHGLVRIFNTYGPNINPNDGRVVINFLMQLKRGEPLTIHGDGTQTRSFCYVDDLIDGVYKYAKTKDLCHPVNLGNDKEFTILELAKVVQGLSTKKPEIKFLDRLADDPPQRKPDLALAKKHLGWLPTTDLKVGLQKLLETL